MDFWVPEVDVKYLVFLFAGFLRVAVVPKNLPNLAGPAPSTPSVLVAAVEASVVPQGPPLERVTLLYATPDTVSAVFGEPEVNGDLLRWKYEGRVVTARVAKNGRVESVEIVGKFGREQAAELIRSQIGDDYAGFVKGEWLTSTGNRIRFSEGKVLFVAAPFWGATQYVANDPDVLR